MNSLIRRLAGVALCAIILLLLGAATSFAQTSLTSLHVFRSNNIEGTVPDAGLVQGTDGNFYGTTFAGGTGGDGTVFSISSSGSLATLYSFTGDDGASPEAPLVQGTDGNFYGTSFSGGSDGSGTVFQVTAAGLLTTLYSFTGGDDGSNPQAGLVQGTDGNFYGTTSSGGVNSNGTVFQITSTGSLVTLYSFGALTSGTNNDGAAPQAALVEGTDGNYYGTASSGGTAGDGTVFQITSTGSLTTLYAFTGGGDGGNPQAPLVEATDGDFYGTATSAGSDSDGTVFKITSSGSLTTLYSFTNAADGGSPQAPLTQGTDGNFYGTTAAGGAGYGTIFSLSLNNSTLATTPPVSSISATSATLNGSINPNASDTTVYFQYGTDSTYGSSTPSQDIGGGTSAVLVTGSLSSLAPGTIYHYQLVTTSTSLFYFGPDETFTTLNEPLLTGTTATATTASTSDLQGLVNPEGTDTQAYFQYGVTTAYGATTPSQDVGSGTSPVLVSDTVTSLTSGTTYHFQLVTTSSAGIYFGPDETLDTLNAPDVSPTSTATVTAAETDLQGTVNPEGVDTDVYFQYGTTAGYGTTAPSQGIGSGTSPVSVSLTLTSGLLPSTTYHYQIVTTSSAGTYYGPDQTFTTGDILNTLYSFSGMSDGGNPQAGLVQGADGNFYGTSSAGGAGSVGTVFKITASGSLTTLYSFTGADDGGTPLAGLILGNNGNFYGTTSATGSGGAGTVFKITSTGSLTTVYSFTGADDGGAPQAGLVEDSAGNFYGTTSAGGANSEGTVFELSSSGSLTTLYSFSALAGGTNADGADPRAALIQGSDGNFYGTTSAGGIHAAGTVFKVTDSGSFTTLHDFGALTGGTNADGANPRAGVVEAIDGNFYGTTYSGGSGGGGTLFDISASGSLTTLYNFSALTGGTNGDGANPQAPVVQGADGNFYGTTSSGGSGGAGTLFQVTTTGSFASLYSFTSGDDGSTPQAGLVQGTDGNFYGTTNTSGTGGSGTVFQLSASSVPPAVITAAASNVTASSASINGIISLGESDVTALFESGTDPALTGASIITGSDIGTGSGQVLVSASLAGLSPAATYYYRVGAAGVSGTTYGNIRWFITSSIPSLTAAPASFTGTSGVLNTTINPAGFDTEFYFQYGATTSYGGTTSPQDIGSGFSPVLVSAEILPAPSTTYYYRLVAVNAEGTFYGPQQTFTTGDILDTLYSFTGMNDGGNPQAGLVQGADGNFYGTTSADGTGSAGTVFKITNTGSLSTLYSFSGDDEGGSPLAALTQGSDGNFYGTTSSGGSGGAGTVFQITASGSLTTLYSFTGATDGGSPESTLVEDSDGNFYGTTFAGGSNSDGTVFEITSSGSLTTLYSFSALASGTNGDGANPKAGLVRAGDGNFYGTTYAGGINSEGTVFKITDSGSLTTLCSFSALTSGTNGDGGNPRASLAAGSDGNLYGTTSVGGLDSQGTLFRITGAGVLTTLHSFGALASGTNAEGASPHAGLVEGADGNFYGTASTGGSSGAGTLFSISSSGSVTTLYSFSGGNDGGAPEATVIQATDGSFYGTTNTSGSGGGGTVFKLSASSVPPTVVTAAAGNVTANSATINGIIALGGDDTVAVFQYGASPSLVGASLVTGSDLGTGSGQVSVSASIGSLTSATTYYYRVGAATVSGTTYGTVGWFITSNTPVLTATAANVTAAGTILNTIVNPGGSDTSVYFQYGTGTGYGNTTAPQDIGGGFSPVLVSAGISLSTPFTTYYYRIVATNAEGTFYGPQQTLTTGYILNALYSFTGMNDGGNPQAGLVQGADGNFYGTTSDDGTNAAGTIFEITGSGSLTTLYSFTAGDDGGTPQAGLLQGSDGDFYGTTSSGGSGGAGTVFQITSSGSLTTLYSFTGADDGGTPQAGLVEDSDGNFYGTTFAGGIDSGGTVFEISNSGSLATLYSFSALASGTNSDGANPKAGLLQGSDGSFYGTTTAGGLHSQGTVFRISDSGSFTTLYSFSALTSGTNGDGGDPKAGLVEGTDGNFYGTTYSGGIRGEGTLFKVTTTGSLATLYSFTALADGTNADGANPEAGLIQGADGNFYGTTSSGGTGGAGTLFQVTTTGSLTSLYSFTSGNDGGTPQGGLIQGSDGNFYGTTNTSGSGGSGTIFQLSASSVPPAAVTSIATNVTANSATINGIITLSGEDNVAVFESGTSPTLAGAALITGSNLGTGSGQASVSASIGSLATATAYYYRVGAANVSSTAYGSIRWFITSGAPVFSGTAAAVTAGGATLNTLVNPDGFDAQVYFEYGTTTSYGNTTAPQDIGGGFSPVVASATISLSTPFTTYYYRIVATNAEGTFYGPQQTFTTGDILSTLYSFTGMNDGGNPQANLVQAADGNFYGTSSANGSGSAGTIFQITGSGSLTTLYSFTAGDDGGTPQASLLQGGDGNFYGTTSSGGGGGSGTVFQITGSGSLTTLYSFTGADDGGTPLAGLIEDSGGNYYGTTSAGGANGQGTIYKIIIGGSLTTLYSFSALAGGTNSDGGTPKAGLVQGSDGYFYGTTSAGGIHSGGTVFKVSNSGSLTTLYSFSALTSGTNVDGGGPLAGLVEGSDGNYYGTTYSGGAGGVGTLFKITSSGSLTTLHTFTALAGGTNGDGGNPQAALVQGIDGYFYGMTASGGAGGAGTLFRITSTGSLTTLYSFTSGNDGGNPQAGLIQGADGNFYGTTNTSGTGGSGTVFQLAASPFPPPVQTAAASDITADSATINGIIALGGNDTFALFESGTSPTLAGASLTGGSDLGTGSGQVSASAPLSGLSPGTTYYYRVGTAGIGGVTYGGIRWFITANIPILTATAATATATGGILNTIVNPDGIDTRAYFQYGTTASYGSATSPQDIGDGSSPVLVSAAVSLSPLTTYYYRVVTTSTAGTFFGPQQTFTTAATLNTLYSFTGMNDGGNPQAGLVEGAEGTFYGATSADGTDSGGTLFQVTSSGSFTTLYSFTGVNDGGTPLSGLIPGPLGTYYGTTSSGGEGGSGTVFQLISSGSLTTLYSFTGADDGGTPQAGLVADSGGNLYGTTSGGGSNSEGAVFVITSSGSLTTLYSFGTLTNGTNGDGAAPQAGLVQGQDGNYYGMTYSGGRGGAGTIFRITSSGSLATLHSFGLLTNGTNSDGANPASGLVEGSDGNFYGTTSLGGPGGTGTLFQIASNGLLTTLHSFGSLASGTNGDGAKPQAGLVQGSDGNFYGTTSSGGPGGAGTAFRISSGGSLVTLYTFTGGDDGGTPLAGMIQSLDGNLYGTTSTSGTGGSGTVFQLEVSSAPPAAVTTAAGAVTANSAVINGVINTGSSATTAVFEAGTNPSLVGSALITGSNLGAGSGQVAVSASLGSLSPGTTYYYRVGASTVAGTTFGATSWFITPNIPVVTATAGSNNGGTVGVLNTLVNPEGVDAEVYFQYGTTTGYGSTTPSQDIGNGFSPVLVSSTVSGLPPAPLTPYHYRIVIVSAAGTFYGPDQTFTTGGVLVTLYSFTGRNDGGIPLAGLLQGADLNYYGTTSATGTNSRGTLFQLTSSGSLTTLYSFAGHADGGTPEAALVQGIDGNFYGTTSAGGTNSAGTVFQATSSGSLTTLYTFSGGADGGKPESGLIQGSDRNFYGTTDSGGANGVGTVFKITSSGSLTTLYSFTDASVGEDGANPTTGLIEGSDGYYYGTTSSGGTTENGTVFKISAAGTLTTLYSFTGGNDGGMPLAALVEGTDGNYYGTTSTGGTNGAGTVFQVTGSGSLATLYPFTGGNDGGTPVAGLIQGGDGNFYGTTSTGGGGGFGTIYAINSVGSLNVLYSFTGGSDGADPEAGVIQGIDGNFYGTTGTSGTGAYGTAFQFSISSASPPAVTTAATAVTGSSATINGVITTSSNATTAVFETGTGPALVGAALITGSNLGVGSSQVSVSATLGGLFPATTYYYRVGAATLSGTAYGATRWFITPNPPILTSRKVIASSATNANLVTLVNPQGVDAQVYFQYGLTSAYGNTTASQDIGSDFSQVLVSAPISGLSPALATLYHFREIVTSFAGTYYGPDQAFANTPDFSVNNAAVTVSSVKLSGTINPEGFPGPASYPGGVVVSWQYGLTNAYSSGATTTAIVGTGTTGVLESRILTPSKIGLGIFHYQMIVSSTEGNLYGPDQIFSDDPPTVTGSSQVESTTGATLSATVDPNLYDTTVYWRYGLTTAYGSSTPAQDIGSGATGVLVTGSLSALPPNTLYHFQLVTVNALGTFYSPDQTLSTQPLFSTITFINTKGAVPGIVNAQFTTVGIPAINDLDHVAFQSLLSGSGITSADNSGIWSETGTDGFSLIARTGTSAPGYGGFGTVGTFSTLSDPVYSDNDTVAFLGTLVVAESVVKANNTGIWATTSGTLALVARTGDPAPDASGSTSSSSPEFSSLKQFTLPDQGGVVIVAGLIVNTPSAPAPGGVTSSNNQGIWAVDTDGLLKQVVRTGQSLTVNGVPKTITGLTIFNAAKSSAGQTRHFNNAGDLLYKAAFNDGTTGIVQSVFP